MNPISLVASILLATGAVPEKLVDVTSLGADPTGETDASGPLNAALKRGGVTYLPCGRYLIGATVSLPDHAVLRGAGRCTVLVVPDSGFIGERVVTNADRAGGNRDLTLQDFALRVTAAWPVHGANPGIVRLERVDGLLVQRITTERFVSAYTPIDLAGGVRHARIEGCDLRNASTESGGALWIRGGVEADPTLDSSQITVSDNVLEAASDEAFGAYGWFNSVSGVVAENNRIAARGPSGLAVGIVGRDVDGQTGVVRDVVLGRNEIRGRLNVLTGASAVLIERNKVEGLAGKDAIFIAPFKDGERAPSRVRVLGNTIPRAGRHGIYADGTEVTIQGNEVRDAGANGIHGGTAVERNVVTGAHEVGIFVTAGRAVRGNRVTGSSTGIVLFGLSDVEVSGNTVVDPSGLGIAVNAAGGNLRNIRVVGNEVRSRPGLQAVASVSAFNGTFEGCVAAENQVSGAKNDLVLPPKGWSSAASAGGGGPGSPPRRPSPVRPRARPRSLRRSRRLR